MKNWKKIALIVGGVSLLLAIVGFSVSRAVRASLRCRPGRWSQRGPDRGRHRFGRDQAQGLCQYRRQRFWQDHPPLCKGRRSGQAGPDAGHARERSAGSRCQRQQSCARQRANRLRRGRGRRQYRRRPSCTRPKPSTNARSSTTTATRLCTMQPLIAKSDYDTKKARLRYRLGAVGPGQGQAGASPRAAGLAEHAHQAERRQPARA